ncbi:peptide MFS transporter [Lysinibacillus sp. FSL M8-0216]|uniref:Proton-dependent oligopeptide transporter, POT family n=1 Tax=Lysinibacillus fusiformis TaxID=28031 RepID=A0A1H9EW41_9BACI|nr:MULTISPECIES: peptide MFS transporter [Lysinibacillus]EAZ86619.1 di-tripeptide ABC transporter [Bacillus sp. B14905]MCG7436290.1 peptide MFS transporter [Lysinibacillus fusiformis]MED4075672.1 peptide MFS transporter [Lysinibacillus fusiformis]MED4669210.1 peptide MFS transporter [Lysinibacillus fusiformis]NOG29499.1 peptide MFS transporter [Lysinibacillus fusiformis]
MSSKDEVVKSVPQNGFVGHPKGLFTLFFTEFWERFSYYGMRAILIFFMYYELNQGGLGLDRGTANSIMAIYGSLVYMSGIIGGWIADRVLGTRRTIFYGGVLIMIGHLLLALPGGVTMLFASMAFIVMGTGLLKPNVSSIVGDIYAETDSRRDAGFSIFYMGINMGAFIAPFIVGTIGQKYSFHLGFGLAGLGMFIGLIVYKLTEKKYLGLAGLQVNNPLKPEERKKVFAQFGIVALLIIILGAIGIKTGTLTMNVFSLIITALGVLIPTVFFIYMYRSEKTTKDEKSRLLAYIPLFLSAVMFWAIQEQGATILATYADERTQLSIGSIQLQSSWFQSLNPLFVITMAPLFAMLWLKWGDKQPTTPRKFSYALFFAGLSFLVMMIPAHLSGGETLVSPWWLVLSFFLVVVGELLLSPVGLSATTKLAPQAFAAQTMSLWFLTSAAAQAINAQLVKVYEVVSEFTYFGFLGSLSIVIGILLLVLSPIISKAMKGIN